MTLPATTLQILSWPVKKPGEWDYNLDAPIALGVFYEKQLPEFTSRFPARRDVPPDERKHRIRDLFLASV